MIEAILLLFAYRYVANSAEKKGRSRAFGWVPVIGLAVGYSIGLMLFISGLLLFYSEYGLAYGFLVVYIVSFPIGLFGMIVGIFTVYLIRPDKEVLARRALRHAVVDCDCPACGAELAAPARTMTTCPRCGEWFEVPAPPAPTESGKQFPTSVTPYLPPA